MRITIVAFLVLSKNFILMKKKLLIFASFLLFFSCGTKSLVIKTTKVPVEQYTAITEIKVVQEAIPAEKSEQQQVQPQGLSMVLLSKTLYESKNLYENSCNKCHKLYSPTEFGKEEWPNILYRMQKKAKLSDLQISGIQDYINSQI